MPAPRIWSLSLLACSALLLTACDDRGDTPTAPEDESAPRVSMDVIAQQLEPFTFRAPLDPYRIQQLPDFMLLSRARTDLVIQRSVFAPGPGGWHTHAGPSFVYVIEGQIKLAQLDEKEGCVETPVFGAGQSYFEIGNQVHRAVVVSEESAVLLVVRLNIPVGGPIGIPATDPGC